MRCPGSSKVATIAFVALLSSASLVQADKILIIAAQGQLDPQIAEGLDAALVEAGHSSVEAAASLEDSALMLGCDAGEDVCLEQVVSTGGASGVLVVRSEPPELEWMFGGAHERSAVAASAPGEGWKEAALHLLGVSKEAVPDQGDATEDTAATTTDPTETAVGEAGDPLGTSGDGTEGLGTATAVEAGGEGPSSRGFSFERVTTRSWIVVGVGVGATLLGGTFLGVAASKQSEVDSHPIDSVEELEQLRDLESSGESYNQAGNLLFFAGLGTLAVGTALLYFDGRAAPERAPSLSVAPQVGDSSVGVSLHWSLP
jgi:hypothetical protein